MASSSRVFVGIVLFALLADLLLIPYTILVLAGYTPPARTPYEVVFPRVVPLGTKVFLVAASGFALALTTMSWRALLAGARREAARRRGGGPTPKLENDGEEDDAEPRSSDAGHGPPGYS